MQFKVVGVVLFELITCCLQFLTIVNGGLPGVEFLAIDGEMDVSSLLQGVAFGVVASKNLGIQRQFG